MLIYAKIILNFGTFTSSVFYMNHIFILYRDHKEDPDCNGMPTPLLQRMHRQVNATRVCNKNIGHVLVSLLLLLALYLYVSEYNVLVKLLQLS